ncbi:hypothetical protein D3C77_363650 [compost metagenome]
MNAFVIISSLSAIFAISLTVASPLPCAGRVTSPVAVTIPGRSELHVIVEPFSPDVGSVRLPLTSLILLTFSASASALTASASGDLLRTVTVNDLVTEIEPLDSVAINSTVWLPSLKTGLITAP